MKEKKLSQFISEARRRRATRVPKASVQDTNSVVSALKKVKGAKVDYKLDGDILKSASIKNDNASMRFSIDSEKYTSIYITGALIDYFGGWQTTARDGSEKAAIDDKGYTVSITQTLEKIAKTFNEI